MKNARLRNNVEDGYAKALGITLYAFARCEWDATYCAERIKPGSIAKFKKKKFTAGDIAKELRNLVRNMPKSKERGELMTAAEEFYSLVKVRNKIMHGNPCSNGDGHNRLSYSGKIFEIPNLEDAADEFTACSMELNRMLHGFLDTYVPKK